MNFHNVFEQILVLFLILIVGYISRRVNIIDDRMTKGLSNMLLKLALPALIIDSLQQSFSRELLKQSGQILIISLFVYAASCLVAFFFTKLVKAPSNQIGVLRFAILFSNVGFMGYPVVQAVFGREALFYAAVYNLPFNLLVFTLGILVINLGSDNGRRIHWRMFVNPALISVLIGFILFVCSIRLPGAVATTVKDVGALTTPLSMIMIGALLFNSDPRQVFGNWRVYAVSLVRLLLIPLGVWAVLRMFVSQPIMVGVPTIIAAMPVAANTAILAEEYDANPQLASQVVFISTLLSIVTIPLLAYFTV